MLINYIIIWSISLLGLILPLLGAIAFFTLAERKIMASVQRRKGPNVVGIWGLLQPIADGVKLLLKENLIPSNANFILFLSAPVITFTLSLVGWSVLPFDSSSIISDVSLSLLVIFVVSSLGIYGVILSGWASNSKYAFLGSLRSAAQMISYEIAIGFVFIGVILCSGSLNFTAIIFAQQSIWYVTLLLPLCGIFFISMLAETNRAPFDLPEAEAEIVAGYNVEYAAMLFAMFFLGEYSNMLIMSSLLIILFAGGWWPLFFNGILPGLIWFSLKVACVAFFFILIRAALPRVRYDQLMYLGWKNFLPFTLGYLIFISGILYGFNALPFIDHYIPSSYFLYLEYTL